MGKAGNHPGQWKELEKLKPQPWWVVATHPRTVDFVPSPFAGCWNWEGPHNPTLSSPKHIVPMILWKLDKMHSSKPQWTIIQRGQEQKGPGGGGLYHSICLIVFYCPGRDGPRHRKSFIPRILMSCRNEAVNYSILPGLRHLFNTWIWNPLKRIFSCPTGQSQAVYGAKRSELCHEHKCHLSVPKYSIISAHSNNRKIEFHFASQTS